MEFTEAESNMNDLVSEYQQARAAGGGGVIWMDEARRGHVLTAGCILACFKAPQELPTLPTILPLNVPSHPSLSAAGRGPSALLPLRPLPDPCTLAPRPACSTRMPPLRRMASTRTRHKAAPACVAQPVVPRQRSAPPAAPLERGAASRSSLSCPAVLPPWKSNGPSKQQEQRQPMQQPPQRATAGPSPLNASM